MRTRGGRSGFTLAEVLVTVAITAVLAAVVVPAVVQQVKKGNAPSFMSDINGLRTGITTFTSDTRQFPSKISQITGGTLAGTDSDLFGVKYSSTATSNFRGPYLSTSQNVATNGYSMAGYPTVVWSNILRKPASGTCGAGTLYLKDSLPGLDTLTVHNIDLDVDGLTANLNTTGGLRYYLTGTTVDSLVYCLIAATQ